MGKRELVIILGAILLGAILYRASVPPSERTGRGLDVRAILDHLRRDLQRDRARADHRTTRALAVEADVHEIAIHGVRGSLAVRGEPRDDLLADLRVEARGPSEAEAAARAKQGGFEITTMGDGLVVTVRPPSPDRTSLTHLTLRVPARMRVRVDSGVGPTEIRDLAAADTVTSRGDLVLAAIAGDVRAEHSDGRVDLHDVGSVRLAGRRIEAALDRVGGPMELDVVDGRVTVRAAMAPVRANARRTRLDLALARAVAVDVATTDASIALSLPHGGATIEALAALGDITVSDLALAVTRTGRDARIIANLDGGGPTIVLRATRGDIYITR